MAYSVYEIARALGVTKPTVRKQIRELQLTPIEKVENNKLLYSVDDANKVALAMHKRFTFGVESSENLVDNVGNSGGNGVESSESSENLVEKSGNRVETDGNLQAVDSLIQILREEIAKKDKEIAELKQENQKKDERIERLYLSIQENAEKALYITAADKTAAIMDKRKEVTDAERKENIFTRIFGKRDNNK